MLQVSRTCQSSARLTAKDGRRRQRRQFFFANPAVAMDQVEVRRALSVADEEFTREVRAYTEEGPHVTRDFAVGLQLGAEIGTMMHEEVTAMMKR